MIVVNSEALKIFLVDELKSRCSADPQSLTRYVMALLKKKRKEKELRACLLDSLDVFLGKGTSSFVDILLETLKSESYFEKITPESSGNENARGAELPPGKNETNKEDPLVCVCGDPESPERDNVNLDTNLCKREDLSPTENVSQGSCSLSLVPPPPPTMMSSQRCKAYDQVGYCMAGSSCSYYHGNDAVVVDDVACIPLFPENKNAVILSHGVTPPLPPTPSFPLPPLPPEPPHPVYLPTHPVPEAYNPEHPGIEIDAGRATLYSSSYNTRKRELVVLPTNATMNEERHTHRTCIGHTTHQVKRKAFDFNRLGPKPKFVKSSNTIQLSNVPPEWNKIVTLNSLFAKFGTITNIELGNETSVIRFEKPSQANSAFKNAPKCAFNILYDGEVKTQIGKEPKKPLFEKKEGNIFNKSNKSNAHTTKEEKAINTHTHKKLELLKKKQHLLKARIDYYKVIVEKMSTVKHTQKRESKEMEFLLDTLKTVYNKILTMKTEIYNESLELRKSLCPDTHITPGKKPLYNEKQLLDAEMDFYHQNSLLHPSKSSEDKKDLLFAVHELKEKAKWLGLFEKQPSNEILERNSLSDEKTTNSVQEDQEITEQSSDISKSNSLLLGDDEEEDEEEDSEARSWRR